MAEPPKPPGNPNPNYGRMFKMEKGVPTTPVTVTPIDADFGMTPDGGEHWVDTEARKLSAVVDFMAARGVDLSRHLSGSAALAIVQGRTFGLDFAFAALSVIEKLEERVKALETKPAATDGGET